MRTWKIAKSIVYLGAALGMLLFAWPKLHLLLSWSEGTVFVYVWLLFAFLVILSQLHYLLLTSEQQEEKIQRLRKLRRMQWQQKLSQTLERKTRVRGE